MSSTNVHRTNAVWHNNTQKYTTAFSSCSVFTSCQRVWCCAEANLHVVMKGWAPCDMCHIWINVFLHFCFSAFKKHVRVITTNICYTSEKKACVSFLLSIRDNGDNISQQTGKWALRGRYCWIPGVGGETSVLWINDSDMDGGLKRSVTVLFSNFSLTGWLNNDKHTLLHSRPIYRLHCKSQTKAADHKRPAKTATRYEFRQSAYMIMSSFIWKADHQWMFTFALDCCWATSLF